MYKINVLEYKTQHLKLRKCLSPIIGNNRMPPVISMPCPAQQNLVSPIKTYEVSNFYLNH